MSQWVSGSVRQWTDERKKGRRVEGEKGRRVEGENYQLSMVNGQLPMKKQCRGQVPAETTANQKLLRGVFGIMNYDL